MIIRIRMRKKTAITFCIVILCMCLMGSGLLCISAVFEVVSGKDAVIDISSVSKENINLTDEYYISNLTVFDWYAESQFKIEKTEIGDPVKYLLAAFPDRNNDICYASLEIYEFNAIYEDIITELESRGSEISFPTLSGCFHCEDISELDEDLITYYREACSVAGDVIDGSPLDIHLIYDAEDQEAFAAANPDAMWSLLGFGLAGIIFSAGFLIFLLNERKKIIRLEQKLSAAYALKNNNWNSQPVTSSEYMPFQPSDYTDYRDEQDMKAAALAQRQNTCNSYSARPHNGRVGFGKAVILFFRHYVDFRGRASRSEYWWIILFKLLIQILISPLFLYVWDVARIISLLIFGGFLLPSLSLSIRRLHDTGKSGKYLLMALIPMVGPVILIIQYCRGSDIDNRWGPGPSISVYDSSQNDAYRY